MSMELRERAKKLARDHGYTSNLTQSRAGARRWRSETESGITVGLLVDNSNRFNLWARNQIRKYAASLGYRVEPVVLSDFASPTEAARKLTYRGIEALLVAAVFDETTVREFPWSDFCAVGLMPGYCRAPVPLVIPDMEFSLGRALHEAHARGYRRPGLALYAESLVPLDDFEKKIEPGVFSSTAEVLGLRGSPPFRGYYPENAALFGRWLRRIVPIL
jgi:DNA-binding LacI/PurR family transcriptional regulator